MLDDKLYETHDFRLQSFGNWFIPLHFPNKHFLSFILIPVPQALEHFDQEDQDDH